MRCSWLLVPFLLACTDPTTPGTTPGPDVADLADFGPHPVGYQTVEITYTPAGRDAPRTFKVDVWYPGEPGGFPATYSAAGIVEFEAPLATDADPAAGTEIWPVAAYSHGSGGVASVGYPYGEHLASHGWVVVSPDHKGNRALDLLLGPRDPFVQSAVDRPQDVSAALDWLEQLTDDPLAGRADTSQVLMIGHSFGGYTTLAIGGADPSVALLEAGCPNVNDDGSCALLADEDFVAAVEGGFADPRVVGLVPQAPAVRFQESAAIAGLTQPTLLQTAVLDATTTQETSAEPAWSALDGPTDTWLQIEEGGHLTFLSVCDDLDDDTIKTFQPSAFDDGCGPDFIPVSEALPVLRSYVYAWGRATVLGETEWLDVVADSPVPAGFTLEVGASAAD